MRTWLVAAWLVLAAATASCDALGDVVTTGPIAQRVAEDNARFASGMSMAAVEVVASRLSTYGVERPGGRAAAPEREVWVVTLSGAFPYGSCLIVLFPSPSVRAAPCPTPATRQRILVDARNGQVIDRILPG